MLPAITCTVLRYAKLPNSLRENFTISSEIIQQLRERDYLNQWRLANGSQWFHVLLEDHAIFQFQASPSASYQYLECPLDVPTYREFVLASGRPFRDRHQTDLQEEYSLVLETAPLKAHVTPIRYDFDQHAYRPGIHPAAHLHIGYGNEIRIGLRREMTPLAFLLFVVRQRYPANWESLLDSSIGSQLESFIRKTLPPIAAKYFCDYDSRELYLE
jgi:hypothetical protein